MDDITSDIIDVAPQELATITYPGGAVVELGKELTPTQVKQQPVVKWSTVAGALYTLLMIDADAPWPKTAKISREVCHWLVINIHDNNIAEGQTVAEYIGSAPSIGTGLHRYIFLIFKQAGKIITKQFSSKTSREGRINIKTRDYIAKYKLGIPVAGNYYRAQYDDYVPVLHASFE